MKYVYFYVVRFKRRETLVLKLRSRIGNATGRGVDYYFWRMSKGRSFCFLTFLFFVIIVSFFLFANMFSIHPFYFVLFASVSTIPFHSPLFSYRFLSPSSLLINYHYQPPFSPSPNDFRLPRPFPLITTANLSFLPIPSPLPTTFHFVTRLV